LLAANLAAVRARIAAAATACGRDPAEVTLIAVTKTWPATDVARLVGLGVHDFAENRDAEAAAKAAECTALGVRGLRWHFVGQVQTNQAASVAGYADVVHSVDRDRLVARLAAACERTGRSLDVLVQVSLDAAAGPGRGGAAPSTVAELCAAVVAAPRLRLRGLMGVAPLGAPPGRAFAMLHRCAVSVRAEHPDASWISAGMSGDLEAAIEHGATHVRVGSGLLGTRPPKR
jgi:pyridoxal phosphate enzyme (YggS family)